MIYRNFPHLYLSWVDLEKLSSDPPNLGVISESFRLSKLLDRLNLWWGHSLRQSVA